MHWKRYVVFLLCIALMVVSSPVSPAHAEEGSMAYVNTDQVYVRSGAGTGNSPLQFNGNNILLYKGQYVQVIGTAKDSDGAVWDNISFIYYGHKYTGYMKGNYVMEFSLDSEYEEYLNQQGFPESYKPFLRALYEASGKKWRFEAYKTGLDWNRTIDMESTLGVSLVDGSNTALRSTEPGAYNSATGEWKQYEPGWYAASRSTVAFYMDPRNYLIDGTCFAFEKLSANSSITFDHLKKAFAGYEWASDSIVQEFLQAGEEANVSPLFLASRSKQELGRKTTTNATGYDIDGVKYYNFFNIGAYGSSNPNQAGLIYASKTDEATGRPWDSTYKAILGGAKFLAKSYIGRGQDSLYLQKFNVTSNNTYSHQYMTNIRASYSEGWAGYKVYKDLDMLDTSFTLTIPVYENMPDITPLPTKYDEPGIVSYEYVETLGWKLSDSYVSGIEPGTTANSITERIKAINGSAEVTIKDKSGEAITDSNVGTGGSITIKDDSGTMIYTFVIYGDVNGDGQIGATDLLYVKKHILGTAPLYGAAQRSATIANGQIGATSLLAIKKHILGTSKINQQ